MTDAAPMGAIRYGGFWRRFLAMLIDVIVLGAATFIIDLVISFALLLSGLVAVPGPGARESMAMQVPVGIVNFIGQWFYFALLESSSMQATLGKLALSLRVTDLAGRRISFGRATGRYFGKIVSSLTLLIGFIMAGFTARKQALHDKIAGTLVIRE